MVQRDRRYREASDAIKQVEQYREELAQLETALAEKDGDNETAKAMLAMISKLSDALIQTAQNADISKKINDSLK